MHREQLPTHIAVLRAEAAEATARGWRDVAERLNERIEKLTLTPAAVYPCPHCVDGITEINVDGVDGETDCIDCDGTGFSEFEAEAAE